jgi:hypothetical protein
LAILAHIVVALTSQQLADLRAFAMQESIPLVYPDEFTTYSLAEHDRSATADSECEPITPGNSTDVSVALNENAAKDVPLVLKRNWCRLLRSDWPAFLPEEHPFKNLA